ncbi:hypothetical protein [Paenibacillus sp. BC26]|uniref:hypothetical protein n=1 Tax=Paenibacillus sp. BC26 TaxID=1881032 RepID=UPI0008EE1A1C|nr:hypothetical protein [Paenibacillus sp. BC26]SFT04267.1 hypothetical protein SAMN05428962_3923 [Paenibacillus sp. BC26]
MSLNKSTMNVVDLFSFDGCRSGYRTQPGQRSFAAVSLTTHKRINDHWLPGHPRSPLKHQPRTGVLATIRSRISHHTQAHHLPHIAASPTIRSWVTHLSPPL